MPDGNTFTDRTLVPDMAGINDYDPAVVGLRTILRRNSLNERYGSLKPHHLESFDAVALPVQPVKDSIGLEIRIHELASELEAKVARAREAVARAWSEGFRAGREKGAAEAACEAEEQYRRQIETIQEQMAAFVNAIETGKRELFAGYEDLMLELCCRMVKKILGTEPAHRETVILPVLRKALAGVAERDRLVIRVSPADFETVSGNREFWAPVAERVKEIAIEPDERIERGGCIIESDNGIVDAQPSVQLDELSAIVERAWESVSEK